MHRAPPPVAAEPASARVSTLARGHAALRIDVAGVTLAVHGARGEAGTWARRRYGPFLSRRRAHWDVRFGVGARRDERDPQVRTTPAGFVVRLAGCRAVIDRARHRVEARVPSVPAAVSPNLLRLVAGLILLERGAFMLHASAVLDRDHARVFWGPSGSGKTTIARLAGPRVVLNDETVALRPGRYGWDAVATPFYGQGGPAMAQVNARAPLRAGFFLRKAAGFSHRRLSAHEAVARLFGQVFLPKHDGRIVERLLTALTAFTTAVPCYELGFVPDAGLWDYLDAL